MKTAPSSRSPVSPDSALRVPGVATLPSKPIVIAADAGDFFARGGFGIRWKVDGDQTAQRFSVVHHPMAPRTLAAPLHRHHREDEYSYVLTGTLGALLGEDVVTAGPGNWIFKPRGQWHTFWNAGDTPCEIIEVISPAGFEDYFRALAAAWPNLEKFSEIARSYELDVDVASVPALCARFGVTL